MTTSGSTSLSATTSISTSSMMNITTNQISTTLTTTVLSSVTTASTISMVNATSIVATTQATIATTSNYSLVQSMNSSALTINSQRFCHPTPCIAAMHFYQVIALNVSMDDKYTIQCHSCMDTYGYLFNTTFDPTDTTKNLVEEGDDYGSSTDIFLTVTLQRSIRYILVSTTYSLSVLGPFSITSTGLVPIVFNLFSNESAPASFVISQGSSSLASTSPVYFRTGTCTTPNFYYNAFAIHVYTAGVCNISLASNFDSYEYLYNNTFNSSARTTNMLQSNDDGTGSTQFFLSYFIDILARYIVVVTTYSASITGPFAINIFGPN
ncbi:unnamed protein product [Rotaria magnacalcarata]|uniref:Uncharacterized protein n=2 Tax=Rotaria magnacalcarata TaxID=392030 RepID=A0A816EKU5_9BILA|nr:unnamed protein product [Rotaria magnacalcarata]